MGKIKFQSDYFFNHKTKMNDMFGDAACPVDMNGGLVVEKTDKWGMCTGCNEVIEDGIRSQFGLETPNESY